jgi:hypothetical protein
MWKEVIVANFKGISFQHLPGRTEEDIMKHGVRVAGIRVKIGTRDLWNIKK